MRARAPARGIAAALLALALGAGAVTAQDEGEPGPRGGPHRPAEERPKPKEMTLETADGLRLAAELTEPAGGGEGKPAVVALHHAKGDRAAWRAAAALLAEHGVSVLALDLRGHGGSRVQGTDDLGPRAEAGDAELWKAAAADVTAGLAWLRGTLLADGKNLGVAGVGAGAALALAAAGADTGVRAVLCVEPLPAAFGLPGASAAGRWDGRPAGAVLSEACEKDEAAYALRNLRKHARTEVVTLPGDARADPAAFLAGDRAAAEAAQFLLGWFFRPRLTGKPEGGVQRGGGIFAGGSSMGGGPVAGGLRYSGYEAPGRVTGIQVLVHPDPAAKRLTEDSRRVLVAPARGKDGGVTVTVDRWTGKSWKKGESAPLADAGGFVMEGKTTFFEVWIPPSVLGVAPFSRVVVLARAVVDGSVRRDSGFGEIASETDPSTWQEWELR